MITSFETTNPRDVAILCAYTHAVTWAEHFSNEAVELASRNPSDEHLETLDSLVGLYLDMADRYVPRISCELMIEITRDVMRGNYTVSEALWMEGYAWRICRLAELS